jgi:hypothetical protein
MTKSTGGKTNRGKLTDCLSSSCYKKILQTRGLNNRHLLLSVLEVWEKSKIKVQTNLGLWWGSIVELKWQV